MSGSVLCQAMLLPGVSEAIDDDRLLLRYRWGTFCDGAAPEEVTCVTYGPNGALYLGTLGGAMHVSRAVSAYACAMRCLVLAFGVWRFKVLACGVHV
eukprot:963706-Rhodomonas_salina.2